MDAKMRATFSCETLSDLATRYLESEKYNSREITGVRSGFENLDDILKGFQKGELIVVTGYPELGHNNFLESVALNISRDQNLPVAYYSLGMNHQIITSNFIANTTHVDRARLRTSFLDKDDVEKLSNLKSKVPAIPLYLMGVKGETVPEIERHLRLHLIDSLCVTPSVIIVDYLQLIQAWDVAETRKQEIGVILSSLKSLARNLGIPIIVNSLFYPDSREFYANRSKNDRPILADLLNSPETALIDKFADVVIFCHREISFGENGSPVMLGETMELRVEKCQAGTTGVAYTDFDYGTSRVGQI